MARYRKKPVEIEAVKWPGSFYAEAMPEGLIPFNFHDLSRAEEKCGECGLTLNNHGWVETREGGHVACPGDWIITGVEGERYPCKPSVFEKSYEPTE